MAKLSVVLRNERKRKQIKRFSGERSELREAVSNIHLSDKKRREAMQKLQELPRGSSPCQERNRCNLCGRPRGYNRLTGLCRLHMRKVILKGMVPGMRKASW
jgi:small subunit ribosomal protein S14